MNPPVIIRTSAEIPAALRILRAQRGELAPSVSAASRPTRPAASVVIVPAARLLHHSTTPPLHAGSP